MHKMFMEFIFKERLGQSKIKISKHKSIDKVYEAIKYLLRIKHKMFYRIPDYEIPDMLTALDDENIFSKQYIDYDKEKIEYPLLLVNCKSGISYYLVEYENGPLIRQIGSIMGESTLSAMTKLLMATKKFKGEKKAAHPYKPYPRPTSELISESLYIGDSSKVDTTVADIYGPKGLPSLS